MIQLTLTNRAGKPETHTLPDGRGTVTKVLLHNPDHAAALARLLCQTLYGVHIAGVSADAKAGR